MPKHRCPFPDCEYKMADVEDALTAVLISVHSSCTHTTAAAARHPATMAKAEKVQGPTVFAAGSSEEWSYFLTRWNDYVEATNVTGKNGVMQLLKCCDERLRKDLSRNAGSLLADKPIAEVIAAIEKLTMREENTVVA